jgi:Holliday junction resolvase
MAGRKSPLERTIVAKVIAAAKSLGWFAIKIHGNAFQIAGLPDVLAIKGGRAVWMECKRPGLAPSQIQVRRMAELASAGCNVAVVFSGSDATAFLTQIDGVL